MELSTYAEHELRENPYIHKISEYLSDPNTGRRGESFTYRLEQLSQIDLATIAAGMQEIEERYGVHSTLPLKYHDEQHTWEAFEDFCIYAHIFELNAEQFVNGAIAVAWHDWEQTEGSGKNEAASAVKVQQVMDRAGYSTDRQLKTGSYILATEIELDAEGNLQQKHLKSFGPDKTLLAVTMADMYGITLRGEEAMVQHAYRLTLELGNLSFRQLATDPTALVRMLKGQYPYIGTRLRNLDDAIRFHIQPQEEADRVLAELDARYGHSSSLAINAAKTIYEGVVSRPEEAISAVKEWATATDDEKTFLEGIMRRATALAAHRRAKKDI